MIEEPPTTSSTIILYVLTFHFSRYLLTITSSLTELQLTLMFVQSIPVLLKLT